MGACWLIRTDSQAASQAGGELSARGFEWASIRIGRLVGQTQGQYGGNRLLLVLMLVLCFVPGAHAVFVCLLLCAGAPPLLKCDAGGPSDQQACADLLHV